LFTPLFATILLLDATLHHESVSYWIAKAAKSSLNKHVFNN